MGTVWSLSSAVSLAIHSMTFLAQAPAHKSTTRAIADHFGFSRHHLAKLHQRLTRAGLVVSDRGPGGGVALAQPPERITLLAIYETIEGPMQRSACLLERPTCGRKSCVFGKVVNEVDLHVQSYFSSTTLADLEER